MTSEAFLYYRGLTFLYSTTYKPVSSRAFGISDTDRLLAKKADDGAIVYKMELRAATEQDADEILAIYNGEVLSSAATFDLVPRTLEEQIEWLRAHLGAYPALVGVDDGQVVGFASLSPYRPRPAYSTTTEDSIYIKQGYRGKGLGKVLLGEIVSLAKIHGFHTIIARINASHEASIALHSSLGFSKVGIEREIGRKFGKWQDVMIMQLLL